MQSREYVLQRLDAWYTQRVERNYTDEVAGRLVNKAAALLFREGVPADPNLSMSDLLSYFSRESMINEARNHFRQGYFIMECLKKGIPLEGHTLDELVQGLREEYLDPILQQYQPFSIFVDRVREFASSHMEEEIPNEVIDRLFLESFQSVQSYSEFIQATFKVIPLFFELLVRIGELPRDKYETMDKIMKAYAPLIPDFSKMLFGDLSNE